MLTTYLYLLLRLEAEQSSAASLRSREVNYLAKSTTDMYVHIKVSQALDVYLSQNGYVRTHTKEKLYILLNNSKERKYVHFELPKCRCKHKMM